MTALRLRLGPAWAAPLGGVSWRAPVAAVQAATALAWLGYIVMLTGSGRPADAARRAVWWCMPGMSLDAGGAVTPVSAVLAGVPMWSLMAVAMTLPAAVPAAQHVAVNSFRRREWRAVSEFLSIYLALWLAFGISAMTMLSLLPAGASGTTLLVTLALAAGWELTPVKRRALNRCHRSSPLVPGSMRATVSVLRFGWINGSACVAACWPAMLVMLVAPAGRLGWTAVLTVVMGYEKLTRRPRRAMRRTAALFAGAAVVLAAVLFS